MIAESYYWKNELIQYAQHISMRTKAKSWRDRSYAKIEKEMMFGFYIIRKLLEANKLRSSISEQMLPLAAIPVLHLIHSCNAHRFYEHCDFARQTKQSMKLSFVANQIIHSYVFGLSQNSTGKLTGIFFASDWQRRKSIFYLSVHQIIRIFQLVANDYPDTMYATFENEKADFSISSKSRSGRKSS